VHSEIRRFVKLLTPANLYNIFLHVAVLVLAVEVVLLYTENRKLKTRHPSSQEQIKKGDLFWFSTLEVLRGENVLDTTAQRQVLFVFTTMCSFCTKNMNAWDRIAIRGRENNLPVFGISLDTMEKTLKYAADGGLTFPVYSSVSPEDFRKKNRLFSVPKTIVLSSAGRVEAVWSGVLSEEEIVAVEGHIPSHGDKQ